MVQVDFFWSYGLGAVFAMAAARQLLKLRKERKGTAFDNMYFTHALLLLSIFFAPSGICLLWAFTSWETMHVFTYRTLWAWLVTAFAVTNVTQGILGFWVTYKLLLKGKKYLASLQTVAGHFIMFFILVHGWDGTGYQRFFSFTRQDFLNWSKGDPLSNVAAWLVSPVALTLYLFGIILVPWLFGLITRFLKQGYKLGDVDEKRARRTSRMLLVRATSLFFLGYPLLLAIVASLLIHLGGAPGVILGAIVFVVLAYVVALRRGGLVYKLAKRILLPKGELT